MLLKLVAVVLVLAGVGLAAPTRRNRRNRVWSPRDFARARNKLNPVLLGPDGSGPIRVNVPNNLARQPVGTPGSPPPRYIRTNRPQLSDNFGHSGAMPGRVPPSSVIRPAVRNPPLPNIGMRVPDGIQQLSDQEMEDIAVDFFVRANYTTNEIVSKKSLIKQMQRNYGLEVTGQLDETTISRMMSPRCGYPDGPAAYRTFPNREHWPSSTVTYKIAGYTPDMSPCAVRNTLKRAFRVWEEVIALDFVESQSSDADMIIYFGYKEHGDGYPFDSENGLLAHAFTAGSTAISGDMHFDEAEFWTLGSGRVSETYYGNGGGAACVFPFIYESQEYSTCTTVGRSDGLEWCATTSNFDRDRTFGFCPQETLFTYGGNANGDPCKFPFTFLGKSYDSCTFEGRSDGYRWCSTTANFDDDKKWGFCPDRAHGTSGGNGKGASCSFPFIFQGDTYNDCTTVGRSDFLSWCATTPNFDTDAKFGFCQGTGYSLYLVAAHEIGHAIGLDHSNVQNALMYPMYQYVADFRLPQDDTNGARDLYPNTRTTRLSPLKLETCGGDLSETDGGSTATTTRSTTTTRGTPTQSPETPPPLTPPTNSRELCDEGPVDGLLYYRRQIYVFKGERVWRMNEPTGTKEGPLLLSNLWPGLNVRSIDAVYRRPNDDAIVFIKGLKYWEYDGLTLRRGFPKPLYTLGFPRGSLHITAALNWLRSKNRRRTYFFTGNQYFRYNEDTDTMDRKYPKPLSSWQDLPENVEASMEHPTKKKFSLFVKNNVVYKLNNYKVLVVDREPLQVWLGCRAKTPGALPLINRGSVARREP